MKGELSYQHFAASLGLQDSCETTAEISINHHPQITHTHTHTAPHIRGEPPSERWSVCVHASAAAEDRAPPTHECVCMCVCVCVCVCACESYKYVSLEHKSSHKQHRYICSNRQQYIVWVKIIHFLLCQKSLEY